MMAAAGDSGEWEKFSPEVGKAGVQWSFSPPACPWRNGQAERAIGLAKRQLKAQVDAYELLPFSQLETVLLEVAHLINQRPLTVRMYEDGEYFPVAPADLLLGRACGYRGTSEGEAPMVEKLEKVSALVKAWWDRWQKAAFELFSPRKKWTRQQRNLEVGDVVLLRGDTKLGRPHYKLARVKQVLPDDDNVVRTVVIALKDGRRRGTGPALREVPMAVQRLAVLLPAGEEWKEGLVEPQ